MNEMIQQFTSIIQQVADPMFCKECTATDDKIRFKDKSVYNNKDWFDSDCVNARNEYEYKLYVYLREINAILAGSTFVLVNQNTKQYVSARDIHTIEKRKR